jgi:hypothetical protein
MDLTFANFVALGFVCLGLLGGLMAIATCLRHRTN